MGYLDKLPGSRRIQASVGAVTGGEWRFHANRTTRLDPTAVRGLEDWILVRPHAGLLAVNRGPVRVTQVSSETPDLRHDGDSFALTCQNSILGDLADAVTIFTLDRVKTPDLSKYSFTSNLTTVNILGKEKPFPTNIDGSLAFHYPKDRSRIELTVNAQVPAGNSSRKLQTGLAVTGIDPQEVTTNILEIILVAFSDLDT